MLQHIIDQLIATPIIEWLAFVFGILQVVLAWQSKTLNFYAGIVNVSLVAWLSYESRLYAECLLNAYYFIVSVAGIVLWQKNANGLIPIKFADKRTWLIAGGLFLIIFPLLYLVLDHYTDSDVPLADALVSSLAWVGCWMLIHRVVENWLVLNFSNFIAIPLFWYKGLALVTLLYMIYFIVAIFGYVRWKKEALETAT